MYGEWMDAYPLLVTGYYEHNISELKRALRYWEKEKDNNKVKSIQNQINKEYRLLNGEV